MGPKERRSTVLSPMEEAAIVALRVQARLPLDDVYIALKDAIPHLTRSSLHRCLQRHGISLLPKADSEKPKKFKKYEIGYFHIDIAELRYEGGKAFIYVAVDLTSKLVFARIYRRATKLIAAGFLKALIRWVPYKIHTILTDNGVQFVQRERGAKGLTFPHIFGCVCLENDIEHRLTKPYHPWTNGQAERMVRTIKEATVKSFHYASIQELRRHVSDWLIAYNFAKQLKALRFKTPYEAVEELWKSKPDAFIAQPNHHMLGPNT
jgi:transposase-like protein